MITENRAIFLVPGRWRLQSSSQLYRCSERRADAGLMAVGDAAVTFEADSISFVCADKMPMWTSDFSVQECCREFAFAQTVLYKITGVWGQSRKALCVVGCSSSRCFRFWLALFGRQSADTLKANVLSFRPGSRGMVLLFVLLTFQPVSAPRPGSLEKQ